MNYFSVGWKINTERLRLLIGEGCCLVLSFVCGELPFGKRSTVWVVCCFTQLWLLEIRRGCWWRVRSKVMMMLLRIVDDNTARNLTV